MTTLGTKQQQDHEYTGVTITGQAPSPERDTLSRPPLLSQSRHLDKFFTAVFDAVFAAADIAILRTPVRAPRANAIAERFIGRVRRECLDHLLLIGRRHLGLVLPA